MQNRLLRASLITVVALVVVLGLAAISTHNASAFFGCYGEKEEFDGANFPPTDWARYCNAPSSYPDCWQQSSSISPGGGVVLPAAETYYYPNYYSGISTQLVTPAFTTVNMRTAQLEFDGYFYFYDGYGNRCDLDLSTAGPGGPWNVELKHWNTYGSVAHEAIDLNSYLGQSNVALRWDRYSTSSDYYYAVVDNAEMVCALSSAAVDAIPVAVPEDLS
jgi:hypothetical protein